MALIRLSRLRVLALIALGVLTFAACGGDDDEPAADRGGDTQTATEQPRAAGAEIDVSQKDNFFDPSELSVPSGEEVTVKITNTGNNPHTFTVRDLNVDTGVMQPGQVKMVSFKAPDQDTEFVCTIHEAQGMVGTLAPKG